MSTLIRDRFPVRHRVGPLYFVSTDVDAAADGVIAHALGDNGGLHVHLLNAYSIALADRDDAFRGSLVDDAVNFPDGKPVSWVSQLRRDQQPLQQVRGARFFLRTFNAGQAAGVKHFLLGSTPETLEKLETNLQNLYPQAEIVGSYSPPFRKLSDSELADQDAMIAATGAHIVWVGLGTPKQDFEAARLSKSLPVTAAAVGAAFDFVAGTVKEAPEFMTRIGLEWLYRFAREPRRLWKRYVFGNVWFVRAAAFPRDHG